MNKFLGKAALAMAIMISATSIYSTTASAQNAWGAIAFNARGAFGSVWNRPTRGQAVRDAMRRCVRNATIPCKVVSGANRACGAVAIGRGGGRRTAYAVIRPGLRAARSAAMNRCYNAGYNRCSIRTTMCADGSHR